MPRPPLTDAARELLRKPNPAVIAAVRPDGQPISVATWYLLEDDGSILVNMDAGRKRNEYFRNNPRVSLTVLEKSDWYSHVSVQGMIETWREDPDFVDIDRLSRQYRGTAYSNRIRPRVSALITVHYWHGWGEFRPPA